VIGVVLTGARDDGTVGMRTIKKCGGISIVQDPSEAQFPSMPLSVMHDIKVDYSLPIIEIGLLLARLSRERIEEEGQYPVSEDVELEVRIAQQAKESSELIASVEKLGKISKLTCPETIMTDPLLVSIADQDEQQKTFVHTIIPITDADSASVNRLFLYSEKAG
jgi:two-component system chemotaxis response regulator CheB